MESLFSKNLTPLASLLRPESIDDLVGQSHLIGPGKSIRRFIEAGKIPSIIFWGPPGCGKTSLARVISNSLDAEFFHLSGVLSKKEDVVKIITKAQRNFQEGRQTILFLDEIHRWSKSQQDVLLPWVEKGIITLIGATTENPSFTVINALLSRSRTYVLEPISTDDILVFLEKNREKIQERYPKIVFGGEKHDAVTLIANLGNGDLRNTMNILETACILQGVGELTRENILEAGAKSLNYDRDGEEHHNLISAMHKSLRDSDGDAAIYWIGRMLAGGEDPRYIARRMMNFASEDIHDTHAIILTNSIYEICEKMGMPECELPLLNVAYYLADAKKDNSIYMAMQSMHRDIQEFGNLGVPLHLRNAPTELMKEIGYGKGYAYAHNLEAKKSEQEHFPEELKGRKYRK
ncbi:replication-associated recombination protein A [Candidatus Gracilibacteria bacterium]|nr:replication-associated recombination protein A [Candidatus Gracilibacteria bacterium]